ncbi:MAG: polymer-forming cytoskeletal protein [Elusimicrobia bacterium]|nr:polymer-forming cytoskeletal protein [Elusimicrobiota bacterium]MDE2510245.1 polymer-forming cytoskeletal protein [Elusimicrobiota bacterium]
MSLFGSKPRGDAREGMTLIGEEAFFHGALAVKGSLRVEGVFEGDISDAVDVEVGAHGRILGNVAAETLVVAGEVVGNVVAARSVELFSSARMSGDIRTQKLRIDEGAVFDGACAMSEGSEKPRRRRGKAESEAEQPADPVS